MQLRATRSVYLDLKKQQALASRGALMLRQKLDALMLRYLDLSAQAQSLRQSSVVAMQKLSEDVFQASLWHADAYLVRGMGLTMSTTQTRQGRQRQPQLACVTTVDESVSDYPDDLRKQREAWIELQEQLVSLANAEHELLIVGMQILRTRRSVNALELRVLPQLAQQIRQIRMKLDDRQRQEQIKLIRLFDKSV